MNHFAAPTNTTTDDGYVPSNSPELCSSSSSNNFIDPFVASLTGDGGAMDPNSMDGGMQGQGGGGGMQEFPPDFGPPGPNQSVMPVDPQQQQQQQQEGGTYNPRAAAYMWQQNHYMESGFHSASTTQPPSMTGQEEDQDGSYCGTGANSMTGSSLYDLDSQNQSGKIDIFSIENGFIF